MKKELITDLTDIIPLIACASILASYIKGVFGVKEYFKSLAASFLVGIPAAFVVEYFFTSPNAWLLKDAIILVSGSFGICLFNGVFKIFKGFEQDPLHTIKEIKGNDKH